MKKAYTVPRRPGPWPHLERGCNNTTDFPGGARCGQGLQLCETCAPSYCRACGEPEHKHDEGSHVFAPAGVFVQVQPVADYDALIAFRLGSLEREVAHAEAAGSPGMRIRTDAVRAFIESWKARQ